MTLRIPPVRLRTFVASLFEAAGFSAGAAASVADSLVEADARGIPSHGTMLAPLYLERIDRLSVSREETPLTVHDAGALIALDARDMLGQLSSDAAASIAIERARQFGIAIVTVRHAFHFGGAFRYTEAIAQAGLIGVAASNTRPLMPAIGGAQAVVGNNPIAVSVPGADAVAFTLDMALSEAAMGKIRLAEAEGRRIPPTWATDADGVPTEDPTAAIAGLLLPAGGPKGFGLALVVDVLTGVLSGGAFGSQVKGLYGDTSVPYDCAHVFIAIDPSHIDGFEERVADLAAAVTGSRRRPGVERLYLPGEIQAGTAAVAAREGIALEGSTVTALDHVARRLGVATLTAEEDGE
ncbi:Ldh family oxidoreductase [Microbacterium sp. 18062]|uniref:Ldh family oxidoreductase n=1 Tax=Microbacterium sp. 18062 TaxID=2681410 RepID=UPI00135A3121|nr:Ldh family oxidoreductase [Microbacterium sp. 18062]